MGLEDELQKYKEFETMPRTIENHRKRFQFILSSKHLLYETWFRDGLLEELLVKLTKSKYESIELLIHELLDLIELRRKEIQDVLPKDLEYVAKGSYGCVVKPALPNRINNEWTYYPGQVTKLMRNATNAQKSKKDANFMYNITKNNGHKANLYNHIYYSHNLPEQVRRKCNMRIDEPLYASRMPNLGISINNIHAHYKQFRTIPVDIILSQFLKLFKQVQHIQEKGWVHGDIREANIMANVDSGVLTLIDFDWLFPKHTFFKDYSESLGYYSNPPESLLYQSVLYAIENKIKPSYYVSDKFTTYYVERSNESSWREFFKKQLTAQDLKYANVQNLKLFQNISNINDYYDTLFPTFDSYGLASTLLEFCIWIYPLGGLNTRITKNGKPYSDAEMKCLEETMYKLYHIILIPMTHTTIDTRLTINAASIILQDLCDEYTTNMSKLDKNKSAGPKSRKQRTRRLKRKN